MKKIICFCLTATLFGALPAMAAPTYPTKKARPAVKAPVKVKKPAAKKPVAAKPKMQVNSVHGNVQSSSPAVTHPALGSAPTYDKKPGVKRTQDNRNSPVPGVADPPGQRQSTPLEPTPTTKKTP